MSLMTRKDYIAIAKILRQAKVDFDSPDCLVVITSKLAEYFQQEFRNFDVDKFFKAAYPG